MKANFKKFLLLMTLVLVFSVTGVMGVFAEGSPNVYLTVDKTEVSVGDTVTVTVYNKDVTAKGFGVLVYFDNELLTCTYLDGVDSDGYLGLYTPGGKFGKSWVDFTQVDNIDSTNSDGIFSASVIGTTDKVYSEGIFVTMTFTAEAAGEVEFIVEEQTSGADGFIGVAATQTLTIKGGCDHKDTTFRCEHVAGTDTHSVICECGETVETVKCSDEADDGDHKCDKCGCDDVTDHTGGKATCQTPAVCTECEETYGEVDKKNHVGEKTTVYTNNGNDHTVTVTCKCGGEVSSTTEDHTYDAETHECECGAVEKFTVSVIDIYGYKYSSRVEYGENLLTVIADFVANTGLSTDGYWQNYSDDDGYAKIGRNEHNEWKLVDPTTYDEIDITDEMIVNRDMSIYASVNFTGWITYDGNNWRYEINGTAASGWTLINQSAYLEDGDGSDWYYLDPETEFRATGVTRVPYPTVAINRITYAPNAEDMAYAESKGREFKDATEAWFVFGDDGKFLSDKTGSVWVGSAESPSYAVNGMVPWHVGFVFDGDDYYYFEGDAENGGNKMAFGKVYATRDYNSGKTVGDSCIYYFDAYGVLCENDGITKLDGKLHYFEDSRLMIGAGLTKVGNDYIYVRSNGQLAIGQYWVSNTNKICDPGMYTFGDDGFLVGTKNPDVNGLEDGVYYKNGKPYYAGLIEIEGDIYYVKSNGQLAIGTYYITKTNDMPGFKQGDKLVFDAEGKLVTE